MWVKIEKKFKINEAKDPELSRMLQNINASDIEKKLEAQIFGR